MSFILVLVRSFMRAQAPVPSLLTFGGTPSLARYFDSLWSEWIETKMMSSLR